MFNIVKYKFEIDNDAVNSFMEFISYHFGSLRKFAIYLGYSVSFVSAFINGRKSIPDKVLDKILIDYGFCILTGRYLSGHCFGGEDYE